MSQTNVVALKPLSKPRDRLDESLELHYTASFFASAIATSDALFPANVRSLAERFVTFGTPVQRYQNGKAVVEDDAP